VLVRPAVAQGKKISKRDIDLARTRWNKRQRYDSDRFFEADKTASEATARDAQGGCGPIREEFWNQALEKLRDAGLGFERVKPKTQHTLYCGSGVGGARYGVGFLKEEARVLLDFYSPDKDWNKSMFDAMHALRDQIEEHFPHELTWLRMEDSKTSKIVFSKPFDGFNKENWPDRIKWLVKHYGQLRKATSEALSEASGRSGGSSTVPAQGT